MQKNFENKKFFIAELTKWDDTVETKVIKEEWIDDMVFAVRSQMWVQNKKTDLTIYGAKYKHIVIYEVE